MADRKEIKHHQDWALLTTRAPAQPLRLMDLYRKRTAIEERRGQPDYRLELVPIIFSIAPVATIPPATTGCRRGLHAFHRLWLAASLRWARSSIFAPLLSESKNAENPTTLNLQICETVSLCGSAVSSAQHCDNEIFDCKCGLWY